MRIAGLVSNDLSFDQRVKKTCTVLEESGHEILLAGRELEGSVPYEGSGIATRFKLKHTRGVRFYWELQRAMIKWLKEVEVDAVWANDLDALSAVKLGERKGCPWFTRYSSSLVPGLTNAPLKRLVWHVERMTVPKVGQMITVNNSIAQSYKDRYEIRVDVVRNMPV